MTNIESPLTDDEAAVLDIASRTGTIGAIGRWEGPVKSLVRRGFLKDWSGDFFNCRITDAGKAAMFGMEAEEDRALGMVIDAMREMAVAQKSIHEMAEQCAQVLVKIAEASAKATGDSQSFAAEQWSKVILDRAKESLR